MTTVTARQLKCRFSQFIKQVESGEEIVIVKRNLAVARIVPIQKTRKRTLALFQGQFRVEHEFFKPLPENELRTWNCEGK